VQRISAIKVAWGKAFIAGMLMLCGVQAANAQYTKADTASYLASYWYHGVGLVKSPLRFTTDQWVTAAGSLVFVGSMVALDEPINAFAVNWTSEGWQSFGKAGDVAGGLPVQLGLSGSAILVGSLAKSKPILNFGLDNLQAQVFTGGIALVVKNLFHRARPLTNEGAFKWYGPFKNWGNDDYQSFFSGHTAIMFSTANMLFLHSKKNIWVGILGFGAATAVGVSRMQQQKHWSSDVVMGAIVGTAVSSFVYKQQEKRRNAKTQLKPIL
jgi:membrane-associated phospholipid phosphatase